MDFSPPDSSVHGFFQARILEWVAISFSRFVPFSLTLGILLLPAIGGALGSLPSILPRSQRPATGHPHIAGANILTLQAGKVPGPRPRLLQRWLVRFWILAGGESKWDAAYCLWCGPPIQRQRWVVMQVLGIYRKRHLWGPSNYRSLS